MQGGHRKAEQEEEDLEALVHPHPDQRKALWVPGADEGDTRALLEEEPSSKAQLQQS